MEDDANPVIKFKKAGARRALRSRLKTDSAAHSVPPIDPRHELRTSPPSVSTGTPNSLNPTASLTINEDAVGTELKPLSSSSSTEDASIASLIRQRKQSKLRRAGIEFSQQRPLHQNHIATSTRSIEAGARPDGEGNVADLAQARFAPQTGAVSEASNQHMMSYIDSKMAKMRAGPQTTNLSSSASVENLDSIGLISTLPQRQPAALGQIQEIDLGPDAAQKNIALTELATRRLMNADSSDASTTALGEPKVKIGRDGKPRRQRRRRPSEDLKRDQVVEAFLHENKLDLYDDGYDPTSGEALNDQTGEAADDLIAERFQRDFLDAIQSRNRMNRNRKPAQKKGPAEEKSRGPKLGGSRSARAAMHAAGKVKGAKK